MKDYERIDGPFIPYQELPESLKNLKVDKIMIDPNSSVTPARYATAVRKNKNYKKQIKQLQKSYNMVMGWYLVIVDKNKAKFNQSPK